MGSRDHSIECEVCGEYRGGLNDLTCDCDGGVDVAAVMAVAARLEVEHAFDNLASNLAVAGALCESWRLGFDARMHVMMDCDEWRPGCRRSAP